MGIDDSKNLHSQQFHIIDNLISVIISQSAQETQLTIDGLFAMEPL